MSGNIFDILPSKFFRPLCGKDQRIYADILIRLTDAADSHSIQEFTREFVLAVIDTTLSELEVTLTEYDEWQPIPGDNPPDKTRAYRRLRDCGWLEEDDDILPDGDICVHIPDTASNLISVFREAVAQERIALGGYTLSAFNALKSAKSHNHPFAVCIMTAFRNLKDFVKEFAKVDSSIRGEIQQMLNTKSLQEAAQQHYEFLTSTTEGDYFKLQYKESMSEWQKEALIEQLVSIEEDTALMERLSKDAQDYKNLQSEDEGEVAARMTLEDIRNLLENIIPDRYSNFVRMETRYRNNANRKITMLDCKRKNTQSELNIIIAALEEQEIDESNPPDWYEQLQNSICFASPQFANDASLFTPRKTSSASTRTEILPPAPDHTSALAAMFQNMDNNRTAEEIDREIRKRIGGGKALCAKTQPIETASDFDSLIEMVCYAGCAGSAYGKRFTGEMVEKNGFVISEFEIFPKQAGGV